MECTAFTGRSNSWSKRKWLGTSTVPWIQVGATKEKREEKKGEGREDLRPVKKKMPRRNTRLLEKAINNSQKELYPVNRAKTCECSFLTFPVCLRPARARPRHPVFETRILQVHVRRAEYNLVPRWCGVSWTQNFLIFLFFIFCKMKIYFVFLF